MIQNKIKNGFSLIEILAAITVLSLGLLSILSVFPVGFDAFNRAKNETILANLVRSKINDITYELSDPTFGRKIDPQKRIESTYLKDRNTFTHFSRTTHIGSAVLESEVFPFEDDDLYYWQYSVYNIGAVPEIKIGNKGTQGIFFQIDFKVYAADQISVPNHPPVTSVLFDDQVMRPVMKLTFRVHNPYAAVSGGYNAKR